MAAVVWPTSPVSGQIWPNDAPTHVWNAASSEWQALQPSFKGRLVVTSIDLGSASNPDPAIVGTWLLNHPELIRNVRYIYVRTDGSDGNDGTANTSGSAFRTVQAALNAAAELDCSLYTAIVSIADGTYAEDLYWYKAATSMNSGYSVQIIGNTTTPANVSIRSLYVYTGIVNLSGVDIPSASCELGGIYYTNCRLGTVYGYAASEQYINAGCTFYGTGLSYALIVVQAGASILVNAPFTVSGTPAYSGAFVWAAQGGLIKFNPSSVATGSATGQTIYVNTAGHVITNGVTVPGSISQSGDNWGQIDGAVYGTQMQFADVVTANGLFTFTGGLKTNVPPSSTWGIDGTGSNQLVSIANNGTYDLASGAGLVVVHGNTDSKAALFLLTSGNVGLISDPISGYSTVSGTASKTNVFYNAGTLKYRIENKTGATNDYYITSIRTRPNP